MSNQKRYVAVATANRAERGILKPVIKRLLQKEAGGEIKLKVIEREWLPGSKGWEDRFQGWFFNGKPDVVLIPADRTEMVQLASGCYYREIPIFHLWAGAGYSGTYDDMNRRIISSFSYLMMCEDDAARERLVRSGEEEWRCITTGTTHFDDLEDIDTSILHGGNYDLVSVLPNEPLEAQHALLREAFDNLRGDRPVIWIGPNGLKEPFYPYQFKSWQYYDDLPRMKFLGLLKNCKRFISNSSSTVYEAPFFNKEVVHVGQRNRERKVDIVASQKRLVHPSDHIVDLLCNYPIDKKKLLKVYP